MQTNKVNNIKNLTKQNRYLNILNKYSRYILLESDNLNSKDTLSIRRNIENLGFKLKMTLKRLLHKLFFNIRNSNEKTIFNKNLYLIILESDNLNFEDLNNVIKIYPVKIVGLVYNNSYIVNYYDYIICKFKKEILISFLVRIMLLPFMSVINYSINKLTSNKIHK